MHAADAHACAHPTHHTVGHTPSTMARRPHPTWRQPAVDDFDGFPHVLIHILNLQTLKGHICVKGPNIQSVVRQLPVMSSSTLSTYTVEVVAAMPGGMWHMARHHASRPQPAPCRPPWIATPTSAMACHAMAAMRPLGPCCRLPQLAIPCHALHGHALPRHAMSCHATPCPATPCHAMPWRHPATPCPNRNLLQACRQQLQRASKGQSSSRSCTPSSNTSSSSPAQ